MLLSYAGHVADMIARIKNNRALRKKKAYFNTEDPIVLKEKHQTLQFKKVSREAKDSFLLKTKDWHRRQKLIDKITLVTFILLAIVGFVWIVRFMN
ncbi:MAG TPA: hypothetical protein VKA27_13885 [Sunxiuqinia sp.]|nr:hypothetical protein [Sunxiuqinia sp.]